MGEPAKDKGLITEEETATLLQRYTPMAVLALLQEVAHWPEEEDKIDWNQLVAKTSTGITNAREYQMLWHHLAYRTALLDKFDNEAQPLDDDSDLEYEVDVFPAASAEASTEAAACVKVLIASGLPSDTSHQNGTTVEAPLIINIPNGQSSKTHENSQLTSSAKGMNITIPVSVQKQPTSAATTSAVAKDEGVDANKSASNITVPKKKRKKWSEEEDLELISAVEKYGVGNWTTILKGDFKGDRTANQLSQRWGIVKKRQKNLGLGKGGNPSSGKASEVLMAARNAMNHFLDDGPNRTAITMGTAVTNAVTNASKKAGTNANTKSAVTNANTKSAGTNANTKSAGTNAAKPTVTNGTTLHTSTVEGLNVKKPQKTVSLGLATKSRVIAKKTLPKGNTIPATMVRATAVAVGARIATPSDAVLIKAAQAKNNVHIISPKGGSSIKSSPHPSVHDIRTGPAATPPSAPPSAVIASARLHGSSKTLSQKSQQASIIDQSKKIDGAELLAKEVKKSIDSVPGCSPTKQVQDGAVLSEIGQDDEALKDKVASPKPKVKSESVLSTNAPNPGIEQDGQVPKDIAPKPKAKSESVLSTNAPNPGIEQDGQVPNDIAESPKMKAKSESVLSTNAPNPGIEQDGQVPKDIAESPKAEAKSECVLSTNAPNPGIEQDGHVPKDIAESPKTKAKSESVLSTNAPNPGIEQDGQVPKDKVESPKQKTEPESVISTNAPTPVGLLNTVTDGGNNKGIICVQAEVIPSAKDEGIVGSQVSVGGGGNPPAVNSSKKQSTTQEQTELQQSAGS